MHFFWDNRGRKDIIGSFSSDVFERRTSIGSQPFSSLNCLDAIKFVLEIRVSQNLAKLGEGGGEPIRGGRTGGKEVNHVTGGGGSNIGS